MPDISNQYLSVVSRENRKSEKRFASLFRNEKRKKPLYTGQQRAGHPNQALQHDAAGAARTWVLSTRQSAAACGRSAGRSFQLSGTSPATLDLVTTAAARTLLAARCAVVSFALHACQRRG